MNLLGIRIDSFYFVQFSLIVEGHKGHVVLGSKFDVRGLLAGVGINDAVTGHLHFEDLLDLTLNTNRNFKMNTTPKPQSNIETGRSETTIDAYETI